MDDFDFEMALGGLDIEADDDALATAYMDPTTGATRLYGRADATLEELEFLEAAVKAEVARFLETRQSRHWKLSTLFPGLWYLDYMRPEGTTP